MIDALIAGRMYGHAEERSGQAGSVYVTCKLRAATDDGDTIICNVIAFNDAARGALLALADGDSVSVSGALTPKVWTDKQGNARPALDVIAHAVLSAYSSSSFSNPP
jgi:single-stranded DNA-binding protein